jgi:hypothetical protein
MATSSMSDPARSDAPSIAQHPSGQASIGVSAASAAARASKPIAG